MPLRRTRVFGERQFLRTINGSVYQVQIVKVLIELLFQGAIYKFTIKLTRKLNLVTQRVTTNSSITGTFF